MWFFIRVVLFCCCFMLIQCRPISLCPNYPRFSISFGVGGNIVILNSFSMQVANVGDSRVVIGRPAGSGLPVLFTTKTRTLAEYGILFDFLFDFVACAFTFRYFCLCNFFFFDFSPSLFCSFCFFDVGFSQALSVITLFLNRILLVGKLLRAIFELQTHGEGVNVPFPPSFF